MTEKVFIAYVIKMVFQRPDCHLTLDELSRKSGVSIPYINLLFWGKLPPEAINHEVLERLCAVLDYSVNGLLQASVWGSKPSNS